jgi:hypothetical protein
MNSPTLHSNKHKPLISRRKQAHAMFLRGKNLNEVMAALGLARKTAHCYLWEARYQAAQTREANKDLLS